MQWENLTSLDFVQAVADSAGVGIIPVGVLEPHGPHLPLGTDTFECHAVACRAAEVEPAIVFHPYPYGINHESAHLPGSVVIRRELAFSLLENICDEMARHGLTKLILFSGHGGNRFMLPLFVQTIVESAKPYLVYDAQLLDVPEPEGLLETGETGHACESETSTALALHPELVKMGQVPPAPFTSKRRNQALRDADVYSPMDWFAQYPAMYVGDPGKATVAKGEALLQPRIDGLVAAIRAVKADTVTDELHREFQEAREHPSAPSVWTDR